MKAKLKPLKYFLENAIGVNEKGTLIFEDGIGLPYNMQKYCGLSFNVEKYNGKYKIYMDSTITITDIPEHYMEEIVEDKFPKEGEAYYYVSSHGLIMRRTTYTEDIECSMRLEIGNCFKTKEDARLVADKFLEFMKINGNKNND